MPHEKLVVALPALHASLRDDACAATARGIMTTDTFSNTSTHAAHIDDTEVCITGIAMGRGMIAPGMAATDQVR